MADVTNLLAGLPFSSRDEIVSVLLAQSGVRVERIVSTGQATSADAPYIQPHDEWVLLLAGSAGLRLDGEAELRLGAGDAVFIPANRPHWVTWTAPDQPTVWLAIHFPPAP